MNEYETYGLTENPFDMAVADYVLSKKYQLVGRDDQIKKLDDFVISSLRKGRQKSIMIIGEYGTGKTHHLLRLKDQINGGKYGEHVLAIYLGKTGLSIRNLYENILQQLVEVDPRFSNAIQQLKPVEPDDSIEMTYKRERLNKNIVENIRTIAGQATILNIQSIFLLIDEAEDIVVSSNNEQVNEFVNALLYMINELAGDRIHYIMGLSMEAVTRITSSQGMQDGVRSLGQALWERFRVEGEVRLGYLREPDIRAMLADRLSNARLEARDDLYPIKEPVIKTASELVGGNPREILTIFNQALKTAAQIDAKEIDGNVMITVLSKHQSSHNKKYVLDYDALDGITRAVTTMNEDAGKEFRRLWGQLIGESALLTEREFSSLELAKALTKPINNYRLLEISSNDYGEEFFSLSKDIRQEIFKGKRYESAVEEDLAVSLINLETNPENYQSHLVRGLFKAIDRTMKAEYSGKTEDEPLIIKAKISTDMDIPPTARFAISCYKSNRFPSKLFREMIDLIVTGDVRFGLIIYDDNRIENDPEYLSLLRELKNDARKQRALTNILILRYDDQIKDDDNRLFAILKLLGDTTYVEKEELDTEKVTALLRLREKLQEHLNAKGFIYPSRSDRLAISVMAADPTKLFTATELCKKAGDVSLDVRRLEVLKKQRFVDSEGKTKWKIAGLSKNPPWKEIIGFINAKEKANNSEILTFLTEKYALICPIGDENSMIEWYMEILEKLGYTRFDTHARSFRLVNHEEKLDALVKESEILLTHLEQAYADAKKIGFRDDWVQGNLNQFTQSLKVYREVFEPDATHVNGCNELLLEIKGIVTRLNNEVKRYEDAEKSQFKTLIDIVKSIKEKISQHRSGEVLSLTEREQWIANLQQELGLAESAIKARDYTAFRVRETSINSLVRSYEQQIQMRASAREPSIKKAVLTNEAIDRIKGIIQELSSEGYDSSTANAELETIIAKVTIDYNGLFNSNRFEEARGVIEDAYDRANTLLMELNQGLNDRRSLGGRLEELKEKIGTDPELNSLLERAIYALSKWDFAEVTTLIQRIENKVQSGRDSPADQFRARFNGSRSFREVQKYYTVEDAFEQLQKLYQSGKVKDILIEFND